MTVQALIILLAALTILGTAFLILVTLWAAGTTIQGIRDRRARRRARRNGVLTEHQVAQLIRPRADIQVAPRQAPTVNGTPLQ